MALVIEPRQAWRRAVERDAISGQAGRSSITASRRRSRLPSAREALPLATASTLDALSDTPFPATVATSLRLRSSVAK